MGIFPRTRVRGPIEAMCMYDSLTTLRLFPRTRVRGPIEASLCLDQMKEPNNFRARECAAPLKPRRLRLNQWVAQEFPRTRVRGPIEAMPVVPCLNALMVISAHESARPH